MSKKLAESTSSSSSSSEVKPKKTTTTATKATPSTNGTQTKKVSTPQPPTKKKESSSSSSSSEEVKKVVTKTPVTAPKQTPPVKGKEAPKKVESSSGSSSSESIKKPTPQKSNGSEKKAGTTATPVATKVATKQPPTKKKSSSSSDDSSSDEADTKKKPVATTKKEEEKKAVPVKKVEDKKKKKGSDSSSSSSEMHVVKPGADVKMTADKGVKRKREDEGNDPNKKRKMNDGGAAGAGVKVRLGNLSFELDGKDDEIRKTFEGCGEINSIEMITRRDGKFAGVAIIEFADNDGAQASLKLNDNDLYGRMMKLSLSTESERPKRPPGQLSEKPEGCTTVFIGNLSFEIQEEEVKSFFADCGDIKECRWPKGDFTGIGWVEFYDTNAPDLAVKKAGEMVKGRAIRVDYAAPRKPQNY
jgi:nucleolin